MPETKRLLSEILADLTSQQAGDLSGQKMRNLAVSVYPGENEEVLTAKKTLVLASERIQVLEASGGDQDVELPDEATAPGIEFFIVNKGGSNNLLVKDDSPALIGTVAPGEFKKFLCAGSVWYLQS